MADGSFAVLDEIPAPEDWAAEYLARVIAEGKRHRAVVEQLRWFDYRHLTGDARNASRVCAEVVARALIGMPTDNPELARALSDLIAAKDHLVRAAILNAEATAS